MLTSPSASSGVEAATADMGNIPTTRMIVNMNDIIFFTAFPP